MIPRRSLQHQCWELRLLYLNLVTQHDLICARYVHLMSRTVSHFWESDTGRIVTVITSTASASCSGLVT